LAFVLQPLHFEGAKQFESVDPYPPVHELKRLEFPTTQARLGYSRKEIAYKTIS
jgi:hypothetical protein